MPTTRSFESLGVDAVKAETVLPTTPLNSIAYRNTAFSNAENEDGEKAATILDAANVNQQQFIITSFTDTMNSHGLVGWSDLVDYAVPAMVWADDGSFYNAITPSGPNNGGAVDPGTDVTHTFWNTLDTHFTFVNGDNGYFRNNKTGRTEQWLRVEVDIPHGSGSVQYTAIPYPLHFSEKPSWAGVTLSATASEFARNDFPQAFIRDLTATQILIGVYASSIVGLDRPRSGFLRVRMLGVT